MPKPLLIYGSYGYTGDLIARQAVQRGLSPMLSGRDPRKLAHQATALGLQHAAVSLDNTTALTRLVAESALVLHCAGPFSHTSQPMADACLRTGVHYLDITGEIAVFEALARRDAEAKASGVMLLPGAGFDVVPSDCLAAHLKRRLPSATHLTLGIRSLGSGPSRGTAATMVEGLGHTGLVRRNGKLTPVPMGSLTRSIDFGRGPVDCVAIPWGDVSTAYYSTGIPNVEVYFAYPASLRRALRGVHTSRRLLGLAPLQALLKRAIRTRPAGPTDEQRAKGKSLFWGEVLDAAGNRCVSRMRTPDGYTLTALTALAIAEKVLAGQLTLGFQTPSRAYGADLVMEIAGVERENCQL
jgi:short subunit dehydrogenase-like uncharacterized protein